MDNWTGRIDKVIWSSLKQMAEQPLPEISMGVGDQGLEWVGTHGGASSRVSGRASSRVSGRASGRVSGRDSSRVSGGLSGGAMEEISGTLAVEDLAEKVVETDGAIEGLVSAQLPVHGTTGQGDISDRQAPYLNMVQEKLGQTLRYSGPLEPILAHLMSTTGKLLRPRLVISSASAFADLDTANESRYSLYVSPSHDRLISMITDIAAAFEMVHIASLVHDDIIDGSSERRGLPVIHDIWGIHSAILTGDYLFSRANNTALLYAHIGIAGLLNDAVELMCRGEVAQDNRLYDSTVTPSDYFYQIGRKTAALIAAACKAGAMAAGAPPDTQSQLWQFGIRLGTAFQIVDDILDLVSDEEALGKPVFNDLKRGTMTLPLIYAMETEIRSDIIDCFGNRTVPTSNIPTIRKKLVSAGCIERAAGAATTLLESARQNLLALPPSLGRDQLWQMSVQLGEKAVSATT